MFSCANCGIAFGITRDFEGKRRSDRRGFFCPNGHEQWFPGETDKARADRLAKLLDQRTREVQTEAHLRRNAEANAKRQLTRRKNLEATWAAGVCPKCRRSFKNVRRHMEGKHPELCGDAEVSP